jgi:hypothetical protein
MLIGANMFTTMEVENLNHLADSWPMVSDDEIHSSQKNAQPIKVVLLFWITGENGTSPIRLAAVRVPRGTPISKLRHFISFIEEQLTAIYSYGKRANILLTAPEDSEKWEKTHNLPMYGVMYV